MIIAAEAEDFLQKQAEAKKNIAEATAAETAAMDRVKLRLWKRRRLPV